MLSSRGLAQERNVTSLRDWRFGLFDVHIPDLVFELWSDSHPSSKTQSFPLPVVLQLAQRYGATALKALKASHS